MAKGTATPVTFVPHVSADVPWHTRQHIELLYQKIGNHALAFANLAAASGNVTNNTTVENVTQGTGGGGSPVTGLGGVNNQSGVTSYTTTAPDNGVLLILKDASPVAVTLNAGVSVPWMIFATNQGAGLVTFTPSGGTINGGATFTLPFNFTTIIVFDGTNWFASVFPVVPQDTPAVTHEWLNSYNATTGAFTQTQPAFSDISGQITTAQLPASGLSVTITTAALTGGGTQGSMTFTNGILTAQTPAT